ncbi:hypothetical protein BDF20DRAFT_837646 [Mycotypha africana]|uniref:uncharacterized protein n=1 Tax=Mycotypha africana TaxID=64632 RepID=UPI0023017F3B|nr:uncharacterized protein BDF20DRAFT_837646 [Mycotypha africana]KAI8973729.1 hypothetical protein BDF20DRAFT_837646 [Mycotypha africana]
MYVYQLKCVLYTPHFSPATDLCKTDALPNISVPYVYDVQKRLGKIPQHTRISPLPNNKRRSSSITPTSSTVIPHVPPTPAQTYPSTTTTVNNPSASADTLNTTLSLRASERPVQQQEMPKSASCLDCHPDFRLGTIQIDDTNLGDGIVYLYRGAEPLTVASEPRSDTFEEELLMSTITESSNRVICVLAVPAYMTHKDTMNFFKDVDAQFHFIHDGFVNRYMALLKFTNLVEAFKCYQKYNGRRYNMTEPEISQLVFLKACEISTYNDRKAGNDYPYMTVTTATAMDDWVELPTCPVCLERLDESVTGLKHIKCSHSQLQCQCLSGWTDTICPACRRLRLQQLQVTENENSEAGDICFECESKEPPTRPNQNVTFSSIWICIICGHKGCGRYQKAHAYDHYTCTRHTLAIAVDSQYVWDYHGDKYAHRLIQTEQGHVIELPSLKRQQQEHQQQFLQQTDAGSRGTDQNKTEEEEKNANPWYAHAFTLDSGSSSNIDSDAVVSKMDRLASEYSITAATQLDSQRMYYEEQLDLIRGKLITLEKEISLRKQRVEEGKESNQTLIERQKVATAQLAHVEKEKSKLNRRVMILKHKTEQLVKQLNEELLLTNSLEKKQESLRQQIAKKEDTVNLLTEKLEHLMNQL